MSDINTLLAKDFTRITPENLSTFKRAWAKTLKRIPKDSEVLKSYNHLVKSKAISRNKKLEKHLVTRKVRTLSGVTPFAVMTKPFACPGQCIFCPLELGMPKSYLSDEPAAQRAKRFNFDPKLQIENRLEQLEATGHETDKIELIVIGGTFSNYPEEYKIEFFKGIFDAVNRKVSKSLEKAQDFNETAARRIVGISIETRPDWIDENEVRLLRHLGVTKLQVGVQALDEKILKRIKRGHSLDAVADATRMLRNAGFKICYHYMPNLPGSNPEKDLEMARMMYEDPRFKPDFLKIYPTQVIPKTALYKEWERGEFKTYPDDVMLKLLKQIKLITPPWVRIDRLVRDISKKWVSSGTHTTNMRQLIHQQLEKEGKSCVCIRCREIKGEKYDEKPELITREIKTLGGQDFMLSFEKNDHLYSLLRLRFPGKSEKVLFDELRGSAIIREIHTFGQAIPVNAQDAEKPQHKGLGKKLLKRAEKMAQDAGFKKIAVISAVGTRAYYKKLEYTKQGLYMTKELI